MLQKGIIHITKKYSGEEGAKKLLEQGYPKEMVDPMKGAGTRTFKGRGGMGALGIIGKYGMYRFNNMLALVDSHNRGVGADKALGEEIGRITHGMAIRLQAIRFLMDCKLLTSI